MIYDKSIFPARLKAAMESRRVNGKELSEKTGVTQSSISRYLSGENIPRIDNVFVLSDVLDVEPKWLLGLDDTEKEVTNYIFCPWCGRRLR